jgi:endonuclease V-like protein UPF0215 family
MPRNIKKEIRIVAWDDCAFRFRQKKVCIIGAIFRGGQFMDGLLSNTIEKDGLDATEKIISAVKNSRHYGQLSVIMLDGITFGGFNVVDIAELNRKTELPVIVIQRKNPDIEKFIDAMKKLGGFDKRKTAVHNAGKVYKHGKLSYQKSGISNEECERLIDMTCIRANIPEPIRVAHLIASGLSGESRGRA